MPFLPPNQQHQSTERTALGSIRVNIPLLRIKQIGRVNGNLEEDRIVHEIRAVGRFESRMFDEHGAPGRHVHGAGRPLEAGAGRVGSEGVGEVFAGPALVEDGQSDSLAERPCQQLVVVALQTDNTSK